MLLQPNNHKITHQKTHSNTNLPPSTSNSLSFSSGFLQISVLFPQQPIITATSYATRKNPLFITCSRLPEANTQRPAASHKLQSNDIHKKISTLKDPKLGKALSSWLETEAKGLPKSEIFSVVRELRKFKRYSYALQIYEWMNNQAGVYRMTTSDIAIQLDLIGKVHGISSAEQYFEELPDAFKDKRTYGALLNAYVGAKKREEAESIMDKMRNRGYAIDSLTFNVMMTLYKDLKENDKIELLIGEMKEKHISLDSYSYNIWLSACESREKLEEVFGQMQLAMNMKLPWTTYCTMASFYFKFGDFSKSELYLKKIEAEMTRPGWMQYQYLISLYASIGKKEDVYRIWNLYKATFPNIQNLGYYSIICSLVRLDDIEGAERVYYEWLSVKSIYDTSLTRAGDLLLQSYVTKGLSEKAKTFLDQMIVAGGKPNSITWEILAEDFIRCGNIPEALSCLGKAASVECSNNSIWKPKPANVSLILEIIERDSDVASKDVLFKLLRKVGCLDDVGYMSAARISNGIGEEDRVVSDGVNAGDFVVYDQLQNSVLFPQQPIVSSTSYVTGENSVFSTCSHLPEANRQGAAGSDKGPSLQYIAMQKKILMLKDPKLDKASVFSWLEKEAKGLPKSDVCRIVKELRYFKRYNYALQVYEWMNNQAGRYRMDTGDISIQLDLIGKLHGISSAEQYFQKLPDAFKDKKTYRTLFNLYVRAKMREEAESIMHEMRKQGYANDTLTFNVMMSHYKNLKKIDKIELLIGEMKAKNIWLDSYSYNIWLSACDTPEKLEEVFGQMQRAKKLHWANYFHVASLYIKFEEFAKAEEFLRKMEGEKTNPGLMKYHYLISLYCSMGKREDVYRIWSLYKARYPRIANSGYYCFIWSLIRLDDIEDAERVYNEWLSVKSFYDSRVGNLLLQSYVTKGLSEKVKAFFGQMIVAGGEPDAVTLEIVAEDFIRRGNIQEALSYLVKAAASFKDSGVFIWKPKHANVSRILEIIERKGDVASNYVLFEVLRKVGCLDDARYMSRVSSGGTGTEDDRKESNGVSDGDFEFYDQLQENF